MVEQGTHKPLDAGSTPALATEILPPAKHQSYRPQHTIGLY